MRYTKIQIRRKPFHDKVSQDLLTNELDGANLKLKFKIFFLKGIHYGIIVS